MGRKRKTRDLYIAINGERVGHLTRSPSGVLQLQYGSEWLDSEFAIPISLSLPLSTEPFSGEIVSNFFDNLLPDNAEIRRRMQASLRTSTTQPFDLLASAGADCVGALQLFETSDMPNVRGVEATPVSDSDIARMLRDYRRRPLGMAPDEDDFRISIAGAQEKTAFLWHEDSWQRPHGPTPTTHVFKLPIGVLEAHGIDLSDGVENEWLCLKIAAAFGLPVPDAEIGVFEDVKALVVERFDRRWSDDGEWLVRIPQEDLCQSTGTPPGLKYEADGGPGIFQIMDLLLQSHRSLEDRTTFFRACVVYFLLAAIDGHAKNFSVFLLPGGRCNLAPLYDVVSAFPVAAAGQIQTQKLKMAMAVVGSNRHYRWQEIHRRHWIETAKKCRFPESEAIAVLDDCVSSTERIVDEVANSLPEGFPERVAKPILDGLADSMRRIEPQ
jgi:serine/threonine-protein kinase HipA